MQPLPSDQEPLEGLPFPLCDLQVAMTWASKRPHLRLIVTTDHLDAPEVIEVYPPHAVAPRWFIWRDPEGRLHVDDWGKPEFDLPYLTVKTALTFIAASIDGGPPL